MNVPGISLTSLAVPGGAFGLGLHRIAWDVISGVILRNAGQATVGDHVAPDDGQPGTIVKTTASAIIKAAAATDPRLLQRSVPPQVVS